MSEKEEETIAKKMKMTEEKPAMVPKQCQHWVLRKKRFCKMEVSGKNKQFCCEHYVTSVDEQNDDDDRIPCPLDSKHTVFRKNLRKHLGVCNAKEPHKLPKFIIKGINIGSAPTEGEESFKLQDLSKDELDTVITKVTDLFIKYVAGNIQNTFMEHDILAEELVNEEYGSEKRRHLVQTSSILGILNSFDFLKPKTSFIEYGAGKAAVTFWLASAIRHLEDVKVVVVDRASHRNKKDNQVKDPILVERLRADIADLDITGIDLPAKTETVVGVSKHLCGGATDLALRCMVQGNEKGRKSTGFLICVCCHHQCSWNTFVAQDWLIENGIDKRTFNIMIKIVSWCVCGDGHNRNNRGTTVEKEIERKEKEEIGWKTKRVIDFARLHYMKANNYEASMSFYAEKNITLENVCITGKLKN